MGEAKKRGTYEQRKAEGEAKRAEEIERSRQYWEARAHSRSRRGKSMLPLVLMAAAAADII